MTDDDLEFTPRPGHGEAPRDPLSSTKQPIHLAVARERLRIARELHDELGALHTAMRLELSALAASTRDSAADWPGLLQRLDGLLERSMRVRRQLVEDLWPPDDGRPVERLDHRLRALCHAFDRGHGLSVLFELHGDARRLDGHVAAAHAVYRVVQAALTNVVAHAHAQQVHVSLTVRHGDCRVAVRDDGCGFDADSAEDLGHGLRGMRARVEELGGDWHVVSAPGHGTTVWAVVPWSGDRSSPDVSGGTSAPRRAAAPTRPATRPAHRG